MLNTAYKNPICADIPFFPCHIVDGMHEERESRRVYERSNNLLT